jgi:hypothetical protein
MDRTELTRIGAALRRQYEVTKQAPLTPSMLALLVQLRETEHLSRQAPVTITRTTKRGSRPAPEREPL